MKVKQSTRQGSKNAKPNPRRVLRGHGDGTLCKVSRYSTVGKSSHPFLTFGSRVVAAGSLQNGAMQVTAGLVAIQWDCQAGGNINPLLSLSDFCWDRNECRLGMDSLCLCVQYMGTVWPQAQMRSAPPPPRLSCSKECECRVPGTLSRHTTPPPPPGARCFTKLPKAMPISSGGSHFSQGILEVINTGYH